MDMEQEQEQATSWDDVRRLILEPLLALRAARAKPEPEPSPPPPIPAEIRMRLRCASLFSGDPDATLNTLRYMFFHMRCGVFVAIQNGALAMFVPFVNSQFKNNFVKGLSLPLGVPRERGAIRDPTRWWANGNILCNVMPENIWGASYLKEAQEIIRFTCERHRVPDVEFFFNKRDHPQLRLNLTEPYRALFVAADPPPLRRERYATYAPIVSFFVGDAFADLAFPTKDDWCAWPPEEELPPWHSRKPAAFFRGTATGANVTPETNQRLRLATMADEQLDVGIVGWNAREKIVNGVQRVIDSAALSKIITLRPRTQPFEAMHYQYALYLAGHSAAARYSTLMRLGVAILRVTPLEEVEADVLWFFGSLVAADLPASLAAGHLVPPNADHLLIRADLSDLRGALTGLLSCSAIGAAMAENALKFARAHLTREGIARYCANLFHEMPAPSSDQDEYFSPLTLAQVNIFCGAEST